MNTKLKEVISIALRKRERIAFKCFKKECSEKAINSHSQSLSKALKRIAENGHLVSAKPRFFIGRDKAVDARFQEIGVNHASTFKGFCSKHDHEYFKSVDIIDQQNITKETLAKLAFRTFAYEERTKEKMLCFYDYIIKNAASFHDVSYIEESADGIRNHLNVTRPYYLSKFITMFKSENYRQIHGTVFLLHKMIPLSCSTVIDPTMINSNDLSNWDLLKPLVQVFFCLVPQDRSTLAIFAYFKEAKVMFRKFIHEYRSLENIIFNHCEEILMSPSFYKSLTTKLKSRIMKGLRAWASWERQKFPDMLNVKLRDPIHI
jgi:hypothetical protein